jgi:hypothetical protein
MFELFVGAEAAHRKIAASFEPPRRAAPRPPDRERPRRDAVRSSSAAALRSLAERLEPSPSR